jgi:hypothetical protein
MEPKVIIYIIIGILYFLYAMKKKSDEKKTSIPTYDNSPPASKPVSPPDIFQEIKKIQAEIEAKKGHANPQSKPLSSYQQKKTQKEILVREIKKETVAEGVSNYEPIYQRETTEEERIHKGDIRLKNEGIYKVQTIEELKTESEANAEYGYDLDGRQAFIGSIIFERKY